MVPLQLSDDVARLVVDFVDHRPTLASVARVSRTLSGPALDKLWSRLDNLYALAKCMPTSLWEEYETKQSDGWYRSRNRTITVKHTDLIDSYALGPRFLANAYRVRELVLGSSSTIRLEGNKLVPADVDESVLSLWIRCSLYREIFPCLHTATIYWQALYNPLHMQLIPKNRRSQLRSLSIVTSNVPTKADSGDVLRQIIDSCSALECLSVEAPSERWEDSPSMGWMPRSFLAASSLTSVKAIASATLCLTGLRKLSTFLMVSTDTLRHLATLPYLETLCCQVKPGEDFSNFPVNSFPTLKEIACRSGVASPALSLLEVISSAQMEVIDITMDAVEPTELIDPIKRLLEAVSAHPSRNYLREIHIQTLPSRWGRWHWEASLLEKIAQPLSGMLQLGTLSLPQLSIRLNDAGYSKLIKTLPALTHFAVTYPPLLSLSTLRTIVDRACPKAPPALGLQLEHTLYKKEPRLSPLSSKVDTLCLSAIPSDDAEIHATLARNLLQLFPNLERVLESAWNEYDDRGFSRFMSLNNALSSARNGVSVNAHSESDDEKTYPTYSPVCCFSCIPQSFTKTRTLIPNAEPSKGVWSGLFSPFLSSWRGKKLY